MAAGEPTAEPDAQGEEQAAHLACPEVEVIGKGEVAKPWEYGVKVSVAVTNRENLAVSCYSMPNNPLDGHTLAETLEQAEILPGQHCQALL